MKSREEDVMEAFRGATPRDADLYNRPSVDHIAWTLVVLLAGLIFWMAVAIVNAENQRNALANKQCRDRVFPEEIDRTCMLSVHSREHWWEHLAYAMWHPTPQK